MSVAFCLSMLQTGPLAGIRFDCYGNIYLDKTIKKRLDRGNKDSDKE